MNYSSFSLIDSPDCGLPPSRGKFPFCLAPPHSGHLPTPTRGQQGWFETRTWQAGHDGLPTAGANLAHVRSYLGMLHRTLPAELGRCPHPTVPDMSQPARPGSRKKNPLSGVNGRPIRSLAAGNSPRPTLDGFEGMQAGLQPTCPVNISAPICSGTFQVTYFPKD
jgi:hypothetical protein